MSTTHTETINAVGTDGKTYAITITTEGSLTIDKIEPIGSGPPPTDQIVWEKVPLNDWTDKTVIVLNGKRYFSECADKAYSMTKSINTTSPIFHCEVRNGEYWTGAMGGNDTERSELDCDGSNYNKGTTFWYSYAFKIEPGEDQISTAGGNPGGGLAWGCVGQIHGSDDGTPGGGLPWQISVKDGVLSVRSQKPPNQKETVHWKDINKFERGKVYNIVTRLFITGTSTGSMTTYINGGKVCDVPNLVMGGGDKSNYVKCGIYRGWQGDGYPPFAVQICNLEHGPASLIDRVTNPLPWPVVK